MKKIIATMCLMSLLTITAPVQALTVKDGVDITIMLNTVTTTKDIRDYNIQATIKEDVIYKGVKIFQEGDKAILTVQDYEKAGFWGNGGELLVSNGYAYDTKGNKRKIMYSKKIEGKDKNWVKGTCAAGLILWPLLLFGFVKGGEAKLMPKDEIFATTMTSFEY